MAPKFDKMPSEDLPQRQGRGLLNTSNLPALQNLLKRDPKAYVDEFRSQWNHYESLRRIFAYDVGAAVGMGAGNVGVGTGAGKMGAGEAKRFESLVGFIAQLAPSYPDITAAFPSHISTLLLEHHATLTPDVRKTLVRSLVLLRNRGVISSEDLLRTLFPLLSVPNISPSLRTFLQATITSDIRSANAKSKNHRLNRVVQGLLFGMIERGVQGQGEDGGRGGIESGKRGIVTTGKKREEALWAVRLARELWRRDVWHDAKTVSLVELACFHPNVYVQASAIRFFLGDENEAGEASDDSDDDDDVPDIDQILHARKVNKKSRSRDKAVRKASHIAKKKRKAKAEESGSANFSALHLLNDPQSFGENLYANLSRYDKHHSLDQKILIMQLLSRLMGSHKLTVLGFYGYITKYLTYHQLRITLILVSLAQSVHDLTPPDVLTPVIRKIATEFVHPGVGPEVVAAGINGIREVCRRQPWCMEKDLLEDLVEYRKSRDKGVTTAARGILALFREVNPGMLKKKERGKAATMGLIGTRVRQFGESADAVTGIDGLELLEEHLTSKKAAAGSGSEDEEEGDEWEGWDVESDDSGSDSDSSGWMEVSSGDESDGGFEISDSEEEDSKEGPKGKVKEKGRRSKGKRRAGSDASEDSGGEDKDGELSRVESAVEAEEKKMSTLAQERILTPADFAKLNELRLEAAQKEAEEGGGKAAKRKLAALKEAQRHSSGADNQEFLTEGDIVGPRKKAKADYEERMASIQKGREGREKFGSNKGKKKKEAPSSSTNKQKAHSTKNFKMVQYSQRVRGKKTASLRDKQKKLRAHVAQAKKKKK